MTTGKQAKSLIAGISDTGLRRANNQDHIGYDENLGIAVLADGMGGHKAGEIAAQMAVDGIIMQLSEQQKSRSLTGSQLLDFLSNTISSSNESIYQASEADPTQKGMGTTLVAAVIEGQQLYVAHVGDSRLYLYREKTLRRVTKDHSLVQDLIDKGFYTEEEARKANVGHVVTRALGSKSEVEVDTLQQPLLPDDLIMMCSDGLTDMVSDWQIAETLSENAPDMAVTTQKLVDLANKYGGKDNISILLVRPN